ncbi:MAG: FtsX-like permease family protein, partial [Cyclobacteriaceae bacterium]|nr:FtsX-like permease family protein [Cyclobacteriaceae bacterium]
LKEPYSLILTEKAALNLFGEKDALNQVVTYKENEYTVTGIAENVPKNSHIQFDVLGSLKTRELQLKNKEDHRFFNWNNLDHNHVYVLLEEQQDLTGINSSLQKIAKRENGLHNNTDIQVTLQALPDIIPGPVFINSIVFHLKSSWLWFLIGLAVIVIISACFNYTNLSMARTLQRAREVGIRKVVGASGLQVFYQFILEAMIISLSGLAIAYLLFHLIKPWALDIFPSRVYLEPSWSLLWQFFLLALLTGLLAGFVPSLVFSRLRLWGLIKGALTTRDPKKSGPKSVLMVFQFSISMVLIICTAMIYKQYNHSVNFNLGFRTEYILNLSLQGVDANQLRNSLKSIPEVETVSSSQKVLAAGSSSSAQLKLTATNDSIDRVCFNVVDDLYLQNFNHQLIAGSNFKALSRESEEAQFIINEKVLYELGIGNPSEIIGQEITFTDKKGTVVGVVEDFHHETIYSDVKPFVFMRFHKGKKPTYLNIKLSPENLVRTRQKIEEIWSGFDEIHPLQAGFYNDTFENVYEEYVNNAKVIGFMAFLSISISVLGLLGMVIFTTESKMKELSIRKIFGASEKALVFIIGKRFVALLLFSSVMAAPVIYYITHKYI